MLELRFFRPWTLRAPRRLNGPGVASVVAAVLLLAAPFAGAQASWEVVNRFPMLSQPAFRAIVTLAGTDKTDLEDRLIQLDYRKDVKHLEKSAWNEDHQSYDATQILSLKAQVVARTSLGDDKTCSWLIAKANEGDAIAQHQARCDKSDAFDVELGGIYKITAQRTDDPAARQDINDVKVGKYLIVALGDSFTSGEGNPDYPAVFTKNPWSHQFATIGRGVRSQGIVGAKWLDTNCHRSLLAWPSLYALRYAITNPHTVVQFASFACSGAQVLDGFLMGQRNSPGTTGASLERAQPHFLYYSQQEALARFLCPGQPRKMSGLSVAGVGGYLSHYGPNAGEPTPYKCTNRVKPDEVLIGLGGNDTSFSGVVKDVIYPNDATYRNFNFVARPLVREVVKMGLGPVSAQAGADQTKNLKRLYELLAEGLKALDIDGKNTNVRMMLYPDPMVSKYEGQQRIDELKACIPMTRDGNRPFQSYISSFTSNEGQLFGISAKKLYAVKTVYLPALREAQLAAIGRHEWKAMDSMEAMAGHGFCAGSLECSNNPKACPVADRVRWNYALGQCWHAVSEGLDNISDFKAYDPQRQRGMRYGYDALFAAARPIGDQMSFDFLFASAHPTANVHARMAAGADRNLQNPQIRPPQRELIAAKDLPTGTPSTVCTPEQLQMELQKAHASAAHNPR